MMESLRDALIGLAGVIITAIFTYRGTLAKTKVDEKKAQLESNTKHDEMYSPSELLDQLTKSASEMQTMSDKIVYLTDQVIKLRQENANLSGQVQALTAQVESLTKVDKKELKEVDQNAEEHQK